jgi:hypothetical protein
MLGSQKQNQRAGSKEQLAVKKNNFKLGIEAG